MPYDNTDTGILFRNDKKSNEKAPDYSGKLNWHGEDLQLAAWIKEGPKGKFMSLKLSLPFKPSQPEDRPAASQRAMAAQAPSSWDSLEDSIPF